MSYLVSVHMMNGRENSTQARAMGSDTSSVNFEGGRYDEREETKSEVKRLKDGGALWVMGIIYGVRATVRDRGWQKLSRV